MYAKFGAFTRFVTIFFCDANWLDYHSLSPRKYFFRIYCLPVIRPSAVPLLPSLVPAWPAVCEPRSNPRMWNESVLELVLFTRNLISSANWAPTIRVFPTACSYELFAPFDQSTMIILKSSRFNSVSFMVFSQGASGFSRGEETNWIFYVIMYFLHVKKILAVINATYAVAKRKPEKIRLAGIRTLTSAIPVQRSNQLS